MNKKIRVAIADDHQLVRAGISMILKREEVLHVVLEASNGKELLDGLTKASPDVVLLDLEMPIISGKEALYDIRKEHPEIRVIILTMHNSSSFINQMMELGANGYMVKDADPEEVVKAIKKVVESGYYFSDRVSRALLSNLSNNEKTKASSLANHDLTEREIEVLTLICKEMTTNEIAKELFLSPKTIEGYRKVLLEKTGAKNMAGLVIFAIRSGVYSI